MSNFLFPNETQSELTLAKLKIIMKNQDIPNNTHLLSVCVVLVKTKIILKISIAEFNQKLDLESSTHALLNLISCTQ